MIFCSVDLTPSEGKSRSLAFAASANRTGFFKNCQPNFLAFAIKCSNEFAWNIMLFGARALYWTTSQSKPAAQHSTPRDYYATNCIQRPRAPPQWFCSYENVKVVTRQASTCVLFNIMVPCSWKRSYK
jgi:hypothetical protein